MRRTLSILAVVALVVLAGCGATGSGGGGGDAGMPEEYDDDADVERDRAGATAAAATEAPERDAESESDAGGADGSDTDAQQADRAVIRTGTVVVEVTDFESARSDLTAATRGYGGYVSDTRQDRREIDNQTWTRGEVVVRVPSEDFDALVADARRLGEVESVETNSQDVTDQLVDLDARLENLRAERDRLRTLYRQANTTEDVLAVQRELSDVQQEIERLEARQQSLEDRVAFSTLTVRLEEPRPTPDRVAPDRWYDTPVVSAFLQSVDGVVVAVRATVVGAAFALPYLVVFGIPLALVGAGVRRYGRRPAILDRGADPDEESNEDSGSE